MRAAGWMKNELPFAPRGPFSPLHVRGDNHLLRMCAAEAKMRGCSTACLLASLSPRGRRCILCNYACMRAAATRGAHYSGLNPRDHNAGTQRNDNWCDIILPDTFGSKKAKERKKSMGSAAHAQMASDLTGFLIRLQTSCNRCRRSSRVQLFKQARKKSPRLICLHSLRCCSSSVWEKCQLSESWERILIAACVHSNDILPRRVRLDLIFTRLCGPIFSLGSSGLFFLGEVVFLKYSLLV